MKIFKNYLLLIAVVLTLTSCSEEEKKGLGPGEELLTGNWKIESVSLTDYEEGFSYQGNTFVNDTIFYNVGSIEIDEFSRDTIDFIDNERHGVDCVLTISGGQMPLTIDFLILFYSEWLIAFRYNGPYGPQLIDTPVEEFYNSSHIFNGIYTMEISDIDHVQLRSDLVKENHVITLSRN